MNKSEWIEALDELLAKARKESWEPMQEDMINEFEEHEVERLELFNSNEFVGHTEQLLEIALSYQGYWKYDNNCGHMTHIF